MATMYTSIDQLPITLCAEEVASVLGISPCRCVHADAFQGIPDHQDW